MPDDEERRELTPKVAQSLIIKLRGGKEPAHRDIIAQEVRAKHLANGGEEPDIRKFGARSHETFENWIGNKALGPLKKQGLAIDVKVLGVLKWLIYSDRSRAEADPRFQRHSLSLSQFDALEEVGKGSQSVYAYYYETYRRYANARNLAHWPIKIGKSEVGDYRSRIRVQTKIGTGMPECPTVCLVWHTDQSSLGEHLLHLRLQNRRKNDTSGREWFLTNPSELKSLIERIEATNFETPQSLRTDV